MTLLPKRSLRTKLQVLILGTAGGALLLACAALLAHDVSASRDALARRLGNEARIIGASCRAALVFGDPKVVQENIASLVAEPHVLAAAVYDAKRRLVAGYRREGLSSSVPLPVPTVPAGSSFSRVRLVLTQPIDFPDHPLGWIAVEAELLELTERTTRLFGAMAVTIATSVVLALLLSAGFQRAILGPILELADVARKVSRTRDYSVRLTRRSEDEVGDLFDGVNEMLTQIQARDTELLDHRFRLEEEVRSRTSELVGANQQLGREVAERRQAEEEVAARNRDLETLLHVTSHDLREPLRAIESFSQLLVQRHHAQLDEKAEDFLRRIDRGAARMSSLLDDILTLSRAQRQELTLEEVSLGELVREALAGLENRLRESQAKLRIAPGLPVLRVNRTWATQAIYNLLSNALKFTRPGETPRIEVEPCHEDGQAGILIRDHGPGVRPDHAERIFQLFQRDVDRSVEGTGAGLAIVRQVAERHRGRAWVRPGSDGGSEFLLTFGQSEPARERSAS